MNSVLRHQILIEDHAGQIEVFYSIHKPLITEDRHAGFVRGLENGECLNCVLESEAEQLNRDSSLCFILAPTQLLLAQLSAVENIEFFSSYRYR